MKPDFSGQYRLDRNASALSPLVEAEGWPLRAVDSTRVHGETEVTCPARPRGGLSPVLAHWSGSDEAVLSFIVNRDGRVDPRSMIVLGNVSAGDIAPARQALLAQPWQPPRLAGVRVPQRAHLALYPDAAPRADDATESCARASRVAVHLRVREPANGIGFAELTRVAHGMSHRLGLQAGPSATDGTFSLVLDDAGVPHFYRWIRPPADTVGMRAADFAFMHRLIGIREEPVMDSLSLPALALEAALRGECP